jgi:hypothetical protein
METSIQVVVGMILVAHGLVHLLHLSAEARDPAYPFTRQTASRPDPDR